MEEQADDKKTEQTKCSGCGRRFGEMDDEPVECGECGCLNCSDCNCVCSEEVE